MDFMKQAAAYDPQIRALYQQLHRFPEPSHEEKETNARVRTALARKGIELLCPADNITIAVIRGRMPGKTVGLRFDTDALQMQEMTDLPFRSERAGLMHGCGHDAHTAIGVYVSHLLCDCREELAGTYKVIFQPAEEGEHGADEVIATGLINDCDAFFGLHLWSQYETGTLHATPGGVMAEPDMFKVTIHGRGGHGATPELCIDPIAAGAALVQSLQHIPSRFVSPMHSIVVTVGSFHAGTRCNIIAQDAVLEGTMRAFDEKAHETMMNTFYRMVHDITAAHGCTAEVEINEVAGIVVNDEALCSIANENAAKLVPGMKIQPQIPAMLGDDFAQYRAIAPCCYVQVGMYAPQKGCCHAHHHGLFKVDEDVLALACAWMAMNAESAARA
ncbi:MAG: amidohydrolase [Clostridia bacterium]|nr:amidohydrolase [Clostridia bacterium]